MMCRSVPPEIALCLMLAVTTTAGGASIKPIPAMPPGVRFEADIEFLAPGRLERADLYLPTSASPSPS